MDLGIAGKVALVTGASRGVGRAVASALLREGVRVMITARNAERLGETRAALEKETNGEVDAAAADLEQDSEVKAMVDATVRRFGGIDILVNNAATVMPADFLNLTDEAWLHVFEEKTNGYIIDTDTQNETMARVARLTGKSEADVRKERTAHITVGRMGRPEEVADVVAFLASAKSSYVTGAGWHVDGGAFGGI